jgi:hypothetical protein
MIGKKLGHYHLTATIGEGGMGVVYRARDEELNRDVAVKVSAAGALEAVRGAFTPLPRKIGPAFTPGLLPSIVSRRSCPRRRRGQLRRELDVGYGSPGVNPGPITAFGGNDHEWP